MTQLTRTLKGRNSELASATYQTHTLEGLRKLPSFREKLDTAGLHPLRPLETTILQVNLGKMCNQTCAHCHVDAGPDRKEIMSRDTMHQCLEVLRTAAIEVVDLTGGAPEMNPDFRWFVEEIRALKKHVIVRCNLTIIVSNPRFRDLPEFFRKHGVEVASSLPFYNADRTDRQRGEGVFQRSIEALRMLNNAGYGEEGSGLMLNLVYNPAGAFLPASQTQLEKDFKAELKKHFDITFNNLYCITNMPVSRYLEYLIRSGNLERYMERLVDAFNPAAAAGVMCRNTISVGWDGYLYDCDFNQMLEMRVDSPGQHISQFQLSKLNEREIVVNQHCYGCTAGSGSSCGGTTT